MKRTKLDLRLKRQLKLVRDTVRELTPSQLQQVNGGNFETFTCTPSCSDPVTGIAAK
jgi:hypothetical protein